MRKKIHTLISIIVDYYEYYKRKSTRTIKENSKGKIYVNLSNPFYFHRFLYVLLKFFEIENYEVQLPLNFIQYRNIKRKYPYLSHLIKDKELISISNCIGDYLFQFNDENLNPDYFSDYFSNNNQETGFHIPMSFHPLFYAKGYWNEEVDIPKEKIQSIISVGNFDPAAYKEIDSTPFSVVSRVDIWNNLKEMTFTNDIQNATEYENIFHNGLEKQCIFVRKKNYQIPIEDLLSQLSKFQFYLACPGVVMPLCHNIVEAMRVGTIPILQEEYAKLMYPQLENKLNCFTFNNLEDLNFLIKELFKWDKKQLEEIQNNVIQYYKLNLSPKSVVEKILDSDKNINYLLAEHRSVNLIKK